MTEVTDQPDLTAAPAVYHGPLVWLLAVMVLAGGVLLSLLKVGDSDWLARSGCVVVMLGIWSGLGGLVRETILKKQLTIRQRRGQRRLQIKYRDDPETLAMELETLNKRCAELTIKHHSKLHLSVGVQEAVLLLLGTFVWGFGDLIRFVV
jgi:uncharacterized membrane protein YcjF (UPF0283 family)